MFIGCLYKYKFQLRHCKLYKGRCRELFKSNYYELSVVRLLFGCHDSDLSILSDSQCCILRFLLSSLGSLFLKFQSVKNHTFGSKCRILDWIGSGEIIAEGYFVSSDPKDEVHHVPLGPSAMKVGIDLVRKNDAFLWRP